MAITIESVTAGGSSAVTTHSSGSIANSNGDLFVALVCLWPDEADQIAISDTQSLTWTQRVADTVADNANMRVWTATANGTSTDITVDSWTTADEISLVVYRLSGADTADPVGQTATSHNNGNSKTISVTITTDHSDSLLISMHGGGNLAPATDLPSGFTDRANVDGLAGDDAEVRVADKTAAGGSDNHTWGDNTTFIPDRTVVAIEINADAGGGPTPVTVTGSQPAASGAISAQQTLLVSLAGSQPAASGTIAAQQTLSVSLTGNQPAASGSISAQQTLLVSLTGSQPASTGTISAQALTSASVSGSQPAATGSISAQSIVAVNLSGNQPAASGALTPLHSVVNLAGAQPASTGTLAAQQTLNVSLAGSQPSSAGTLTAFQTLLVALAGAQPAGSGSLSSVVTLLVSLAGAQPTATGTIAAASVEITPVTTAIATADARYSDTTTVTARFITRADAEATHRSTTEITGRYAPRA